MFVLAISGYGKNICDVEQNGFGVSLNGDINKKSVINQYKIESCTEKEIVILLKLNKNIKSHKELRISLENELLIISYKKLQNFIYIKEIKNKSLLNYTVDNLKSDVLRIKIDLI